LFHTSILALYIHTLVLYISLHHQSSMSASQYQSSKVLDNGPASVDLVGTFLADPANVASEEEHAQFVNAMGNGENLGDIAITPPLVRYRKQQGLLKKCPPELVYETLDRTNVNFNENRPRDQYVRIGQNLNFVPIDGSMDGYSIDPRGQINHPVNYYADQDGFVISGRMIWCKLPMAKKLMEAGMADVLARRIYKNGRVYMRIFLMRKYKIFNAKISNREGRRYVDMHDESASSLGHTLPVAYAILGTFMGPRPLNYIAQHDSARSDNALNVVRWLYRPLNNSTPFMDPK
jgi:hypothetical protein